MKNTKKLATLLLALVMVLSLSVGVFADGGYTITISNPVEGETYNAYKIFDATVSTTTTGEGDDAVTTTHVSYTIKASDTWFNNVMGFMGYTYDATNSKWQTGEEGSKTDATTPYTGKGLTLTPSADGTQYVVSVTTGETDTTKNFSAADFAAYLIANVGSIAADGTTTPTKNGDSWSTEAGKGNTITVTSQGYYLVDTSLGALCALDTAMNVTIYEKNSVPSIDKQVFDPDSAKVANTSDAGWTLNADATSGNGTWDDVGTAGDTEYATVDVHNTVYYKLVVNTGTKDDTIAPDGTGVDADYVIVDTLPAGFSYAKGADSAVTVKVATNTGTDNAEEVWVSTTDYEVAYTAANASATPATTDTITITLKAGGKLKGLAENTDITITYAATMTNSAVKIGKNGQTTDGTNSAANENTATLSYQKRTVDGAETAVVRSTDTATVYTYQIGGTKEGAGGTETPIIQKVDGTDENNKTPLAGVKFILSKTVGTGEGAKTYYATVEATQTTGEDTDKKDVNGSYYLTGWTDTKPTEGNIVTSDVTGDGTTDNPYKGGTIEVKGLDAGTYYLTEVETLPGYNLMTGDITIVIAEDGSVKYYQPGETPTTGDQDPGKDTIEIVNKTGTELPSTGGMGTTIFYVLGAVLVLGAAVLLITRKRMTAEN